MKMQLHSLYGRSILLYDPHTALGDTANHYHMLPRKGINGVVSAHHYPYTLTDIFTYFLHQLILYKKLAAYRTGIIRYVNGKYCFFTVAKRLALHCQHFTLNAYSAGKLVKLVYGGLLVLNVRPVYSVRVHALTAGGIILLPAALLVGRLFIITGCRHSVPFPCFCVHTKSILRKLSVLRSIFVPRRRHKGFIRLLH